MLRAWRCKNSERRQHARSGEGAAADDARVFVLALKGGQAGVLAKKRGRGRRQAGRSSRVRSRDDGGGRAFGTRLRPNAAGASDEVI